MLYRMVCYAPLVQEDSKLLVALGYSGVEELAVVSLSTVGRVTVILSI